MKINREGEAAGIKLETVKCILSGVAAPLGLNKDVRARRPRWRTAPEKEVVRDTSGRRSTVLCLC